MVRLYFRIASSVFPTSVRLSGWFSHTACVTSVEVSNVKTRLTLSVEAVESITNRPWRLCQMSVAAFKPDYS